MKDEEAENEAVRWLRNYHGSIDSTALLLAFQAGQEVGAVRARRETLEEAARAECRMCADGLPTEIRLGQTHHADGRWVICDAWRIRALKG